MTEIPIVLHVSAFLTNIQAVLHGLVFVVIAYVYLHDTPVSETSMRTQNEPFKPYTSWQMLTRPRYLHGLAKACLAASSLRFTSRIFPKDCQANPNFLNAFRVTLGFFKSLKSDISLITHVHSVPGVRISPSF